MHHVHLEQTDSTQTRVKEFLSQGNTDILVSTDHQSAGVGRQGAPWSHLDEALAFSFDISPNPTITLTPLEIGILLSRFFRPKLSLKWPNDLINKKREKIGGILCQLVGQRVAVGIGLNIKADTTKLNFDYPVGSLFNFEEQLSSQYKKELPFEIVEFIHSHRLTSEGVINEFQDYCVHQNQEVIILNGKNKESGLFVGLGKNGEALLKKQDGLIEAHLTGSLRFN